MTTPKRSEIRDLAQKMSHEDCRELPYINSEDSELKENGAWHEARNELMRDSEKAQCLSYLEQEALSLGYRLIPKARFNGQQNYVDLKTLCSEIVKFGGLFIVSNKGCGKTNSLMEIARELRKDPRNKVVIFETFPKWLHEFDSIPYLYIQDSDVIKNDKSFKSLRHREVQRILNIHKDLLFCLAIEDIERLSFFMSKVIYDFYRKRYLTMYKYGTEAIKENVIFVCEESQNLFDSTILNKIVFRRLRKIYSESRNFKIHYVMASQRIQDLNTKIRARARLLVGRVSLDDFELKISRLLRNSQYRREVLEFEIGKFLYADTDSLIRFDKFQQHGKPYEVSKELLVIAQ